MCCRHNTDLMVRQLLWYRRISTKFITNTLIKALTLIGNILVQMIEVASRHNHSTLNFKTFSYILNLDHLTVSTTPNY